MSSIWDWSTTAASNSNSDSGMDWSEGQSPGSVNDSARQLVAGVAEFRSDLGGALSAGGTANGLTVTANSAFTTLADGRIISFRATASNSGAATLNVNGIGAKAIRKMTAAGEAALGAGDIQNTGIYVAQYSAALNGAAGWLLVNPTISAIVATTGTFSGGISATTGTFSGAITATTVTASSNVTTTAGGFVATGATFGAYVNGGANNPIQATASTTTITGHLIASGNVYSGTNAFIAVGATWAAYTNNGAQSPITATSVGATINGTLTVTG